MRNYTKSKLYKSQSNEKCERGSTSERERGMKLVPKINNCDERTRRRNGEWGTENDQEEEHFTSFHSFGLIARMREMCVCTLAVATIFHFVFTLLLYYLPVGMMSVALWDRKITERNNAKCGIEELSYGRYVGIRVYLMQIERYEYECIWRRRECAIWMWRSERKRTQKSRPKKMIARR